MPSSRELHSRRTCTDGTASCARGAIGWIVCRFATAVAVRGAVHGVSFVGALRFATAGAARCVGNARFDGGSVLVAAAAVDTADVGTGADVVVVVVVVVGSGNAPCSASMLRNTSSTSTSSAQPQYVCIRVVVVCTSATHVNSGSGRSYMSARVRVARHAMPKRWIAAATAHHRGAFTAYCRERGLKNVQACARATLASPTATTHRRRQAALAKTLGRIHKK